jgi:capsular exopolysaccharide synthesis family protein
MNHMDNYFEPRQIITTLFRWWWVLTLGTLIAVAAGYAISQMQTPVYKATATIMVGNFTQSSQISRDDLVARDAFTNGYAEMARRQPVLAGVVEKLDLKVSWKQLKGDVSVKIVESTSLIEISAEANSPQAAKAIAGEVANQLILLGQNQDENDSTRQFVQAELENLQVRIEQGREKLATLQAQVTTTISQDRLNLLKIEVDTLQRFITDWEDTHSRLLTLLDAKNVSQNSLTIIEEAQASSKPISPRLDINLLLSVCIGFGLALGVIFLLEQFDDRLKTSKALEQKLGLNHLGTISKMRGRNYDGKLIAAQNPLFGTALYYRKILKNLGFIENANPPIKSLLVTSPRLREGKSVTVSNLGIVMAQAGYKTIIVDVDWKKPVQHQLFDVSNEVGLMDLLSTSDLVTKAQVQATGIRNLQVLTTGTLPKNPLETLQPKRMQRILSDLAEISDVVILDAPSTTIKESEVLFSLVDGVILVIDSNRTTMTSIKQSMTSLYLTGGRLLGGILNRSPSYLIVS